MIMDSSIKMDVDYSVLRNSGGYGYILHELKKYLVDVLYMFVTSSSASIISYTLLFCYRNNNHFTTLRDFNQF